MSELNIYENNLQALAGVDKELESILRIIKTNEIFEVFLAEGDEVANANILDTRDGSKLYEGEASAEIDAKLKEFEEFDNYPLLYFFGVGNGSFYKELLKNKKHQSIMVMEPEIELIYIALNLIDFSKEILEMRFILKLSLLVDRVYFISLLSDKTKFFLKVYDFHIYSEFYDRYNEEMKRVNKDIVEAFKYSIYIIGNSAKDSLIGLEFSLKNIPKMIKTPTLKNLKSSINTKSAVIVSTGPSLAKQIPMLKEMQDYVTILCIDASFPILSKEGIKPDIVFSIERVDLTGRFYKETPKELHKDVIFSIATVCHDETIDNIHSTISFFMRADSYNMFFGFDEWGYLGGGMSAANFAYDFASKSGFENIIFIGQDLSYAKDGRSHSKNHVFGENDVDASRVVGYVEAYGGDGEVATTEIWRSFLNSFKIQVRDSEVLSINSTEGGARIDGTLEMPFKEACEKYVDKSCKKELMRLEYPSNESIQKNLLKFKEKEHEAIKIGKSMSKRALKVFKESDEFLGEIKNYSGDEIGEKVTFKKLDKLIEGISNTKEKYNGERFSAMYATLLLAYVVNHEFDVAKVYVMRENNDLAKKLKKIEWIRVHQEWLFRVYTNVDAILELLEDSLQKEIC